MRRSVIRDLQTQLHIAESYRRSGRTSKMIEEAKKAGGMVWIVGRSYKQAKTIADQVGINAIPITTATAPDMLKGTSKKNPVFVDHYAVEGMIADFINKLIAVGGTK